MLRLGLIIGLLVARAVVVPAAEQPTPYRHAVVAADHPLASQAGVEILQQGGNVVDAAVAVSFTLSVVRPASCGIGGGGFMLIWNAERGQAVALDYRERAPHRATRDMFADPENPGQPRDELSRKGHLAAAVPGTVAGLCYALERYGTLDLKTVLEPAVRLARDGLAPDAHDRDVQRSVLRRFAEHPDYREIYSELWKKYLNEGRAWEERDRFHSPQREVLELIAARGAAGFYAGPVADALVAESRRGGGLLTPEDLSRTKPVVREPLRGRFDGLDVLSMPPPSSGGVAVLQILNTLSAYEEAHPDRRLDKLGHNTPAYVHLVAESMKHAFADRAEFLGDADFVRVPVRRLVSREYARRLASKIDGQRTLPPENYGRFQPVDDGGTSHFSIIDSRGNAVACTETINTVFGSFVVEPKYGIVLNNQMDDFAAVPGQPNAFGLMQSEANAVAPGKKPLSSMTPTILLRDGKAVYALGASGGPRIISSTLQVLLNMTRFGMSPIDAVPPPRMHHQWLPDTLLAEDDLFERIKDPLRQRGHTLQRRNDLAVVQAVARPRQGLVGKSDPRKHGQAAGY